ncbi:hypothetical protein ACLKA7_006301 [Drosophila subpalustris]
MLNAVQVAVVVLLLAVDQSLAHYLPPVASESVAPIITKQFYSVSAAEEAQDVEPRTKHLVIGRPTRNYRVIFIRAPTGQSEAIKYSAELAPQEERTVIYVLSRKQQELEAQDIRASRQQEAPAKPEIFFIRYRTNEEAAAAQREIQTQYDRLGGNSEHAAPLVAPVQSVVGALDAPLAPPAEGYDYQRPMPRLYK